MESRKYQSNQLRNEIAMDIVVFASLRPGWHPSPRRRGGGGILVKYVGKEPILKNHMLVLVTLKEKVLYVIPNYYATSALWVKRITWIKMCQKLAKVDPCFSFNKLTR